MEETSIELDNEDYLNEVFDPSDDKQIAFVHELPKVKARSRRSRVPKGESGRRKRVSAKIRPPDLIKRASRSSKSTRTYDKPAYGKARGRKPVKGYLAPRPKRSKQVGVYKVGSRKYYNIPTYSSYSAMQRRSRYGKGKAPGKKPGWISAGGSAAGAALGNSLVPGIGGAVGDFLGGKLGHLIEEITGWGDYRIKNNTIMTGGMTPPQIVNSVNTGGYIVRHREYLGDINASISFNMQSFALNPGLDTSFPWLSQIANSFEQYRWRGLMFEFKSLSSDSVLSSSTSSALGAVMMATQYNVLAPPFPDKKTLENYEFANSRKPSISFIHPVECKSSVTPVSILYTRSGAVPADGDQRLYDLGEFCIATQGMQAASGVAGELWATYEVEFFKCKFDQQDQTDHFLLTGVTNALPLGTGTTPESGSSIGGTITGGNIYNFPTNLSSGMYMVTIVWLGTAAAYTPPTIGLTNCVAVNKWRNNAFSAFAAPASGISTTNVSYSGTFRVTGQGAQITLSGASLPSPFNTGDLWVTQLSQTLIPA